MRYPDDKTAFIPEPTGQVINVTADTPELLEIMFGEHAPEVAEIFRKPFKLNRYVQIVTPKKDLDMIRLTYRTLLVAPLDFPAGTTLGEALAKASGLAESIGETMYVEDENANVFKVTPCPR